jgi:hypothetical protein
MRPFVWLSVLALNIFLISPPVLSAAEPENPSTASEVAAMNPSPSHQDPQATPLLEMLEGNYTNMSLEEVRKALQKKKELAKKLDTLVEARKTQDEQKKQMLQEIAQIEQENKQKIEYLKKPFSLNRN